MIEIRKYDPSKDEGVLEFLPDKTIVRIGGVAMTPLLTKEQFLVKFTPGGFWLALSGGAVAGAVSLGEYVRRPGLGVDVVGTRALATPATVSFCSPPSVVEGRQSSYGNHPA